MQENMDCHVTNTQDCCGETEIKLTEDTVYVPTVCTKCNQCPCLWDQNRSEVKRMIQRLKMDSWLQNSKQKDLYQAITGIIYQRPLGKGNHIPLPDCIVRAIRKSFPRTNKCPKYMGYRAE